METDPLFQNNLETYPEYPPEYPTVRAPWGPGVGIWCWCMFLIILKQGSVSIGIVSKLHIARFFKVSGLAKGRKMAQQTLQLGIPATLFLMNSCNQVPSLYQVGT